MAFLVSYGNHLSSSKRIPMLPLLILALICSSSFGSSNVDITNKNPSHHHQRLLSRPSSFEIDSFNSNENRLLYLLLKSALIQEADFPDDQIANHINSRRQLPQSFHAMRG